MIRTEREVAIMRLLERQGVVSVRGLTQRWPAVSAVTLRRDLARLEASGRLRRTRGGAVRADARLVSRPGPAGTDEEGEVEQADALILPPIGGRRAHTLRQHARRRGIPFVAESAPQEGGIYLGPDNRQAGRELGRLAACHHAAAGRSTAELLLLSLEELTNTRERTRGFAEGFRELFEGPVRSHLIDGKGSFGHAFRTALDALQAFPGIDVVFGVNDHSVLAGIEACRRLGRPEDRFAAFSVGGEGGTLFDELAAGGPLKACAALFPEVAGRLAIDAICHCLSGAPVPPAVETRFAILTPANLGEFYHRHGGQWRLRAEVRERMATARAWSCARRSAGKRISFILHYPAHEWYRNLSAAMAERARELGVRFAARNAEDRYAHEIGELRRGPAAAAAYVRDGETVLLDGGEVSRLLAREIRARRSVTVVTNSLQVLEALDPGEGPRVILTGGEFVPERAALFGPAAATTLESLRVAEMLRRFAVAARETAVLADHSLIRLEAHARICTLDAVDTVITDQGALPAHRLELSSRGLRVLVVGDEGPPADVA